LNDHEQVIFLLVSRHDVSSGHKEHSVLHVCMVDPTHAPFDALFGSMKSFIHLQPAALFLHAACGSPLPGSPMISHAQQFVLHSAPPCFACFGSSQYPWLFGAFVSVVQLHHPFVEPGGAPALEFLHASLASVSLPQLLPSDLYSHAQHAVSHAIAPAPVFGSHHPVDFCVVPSQYCSVTHCPPTPSQLFLFCKSSNDVPGQAGWKETLTVEGGLLKELNITDENGNVVINAVPIAGEDHIQHSNGAIDRGIVRSDKTNTVYQFENGMVTTIEVSDDSGNIIMSQNYGNGDKIQIMYGVNADGVPYSPDMYNAQAIFGQKALQYGSSAKLTLEKNVDGVYEIVYGTATSKLRHKVSDAVGSLLVQAEKLSTTIDQIQGEQLYQVSVELAKVYVNIETMAIGLEMIGLGVAGAAPTGGAAAYLVIAGTGAVSMATLGLKSNLDNLTSMLEQA